MDISLSEQIRLAAIEHHLSDQYPDLAAEMKVFGYRSEPRPVEHRQSFRLASWARHLGLWMAGIAVTAMVALLLLPALGGPSRCAQPVAGAAHPGATETPAACARPHPGG